MIDDIVRIHFGKIAGIITGFFETLLIQIISIEMGIKNVFNLATIGALFSTNQIIFTMLLKKDYFKKEYQEKEKKKQKEYRESDLIYYILSKSYRKIIKVLLVIETLASSVLWIISLIIFINGF
ncbi:MAG: hypothetical protein ACI4W1_07450 [Ruminococcus sp.]